ncbi:hypothetical protein M758_11G110000 [Ceratodon purpureus]|nr:hypothetical protein M758_11G109600 [Ceratodon purpureus]KAG0601428.1 hypothetical protein M758_11G110000 [Ceratodon purpureus]
MAGIFFVGYCLLELEELMGSFQLADDLRLGLKQAELIQIYVLCVPGFQHRRIYDPSYMNVSTCERICILTSGTHSCMEKLSSISTIWRKLFFLGSGFRCPNHN